MTAIAGLDGVAPGERVVVAMSGGVDSSVVAALLAERGCEVVGVTLQLYDHGRAIGRRGACCAGRDIHDARRVADRLAIPHYVLDYEDRFRAAVIDDFAAAYARGETPVPCVRCNQRIKFRDLLATARDLGAEALATGHYVRRREGAAGPELWRAIDTARDQSYFLFATRRDELARLIFPLGGLEKREVRALAARFGLAVADKPDSQDICFVPRGHYADVVAALRPEAAAEGEIIHIDGRVLGRHRGIHRFTVGQRRGLGIAWPEPLYVVRLEPQRARVVVGPEAALAGVRLSIGECNWIGRPPAPGALVTVKLRARQAPLPATVEPLPGWRAAVRLAAPGAAIAPGQACVVYAGDRVLGGGFIARPGPGSACLPGGRLLDTARVPSYTARAPSAE